MRAAGLVGLALVALALAGCVTTQVMPVAPNVVRIDTEAGDLLFAHQAPSATMRRAAEVTLAAGYSHFRLEQVASGRGSEFGGMIMQPMGGSLMMMPMQRTVARVSATVVMFRSPEPGTFEARTVLAQTRS